MFLYPLLGGALLFFLLRLLFPRADAMNRYQPVCSCYHCGIATLTVGGMLRGIFEIAGTSSPYSVVFTVCGWALCTNAFFLFLFELKT
jgi:hypothetical protein